MRAPDELKQPAVMATIGVIVVLALALAGAVVLGLRASDDGDDDVRADTSATTDDSTASTDDTGDTTPDDTSEPDDGDAAETGAPTGTRFRVDTDQVAADVGDPFLNVRWAAGTDHDILAKVPPTYTGLRWTGEEDTTDDGARWYEVELLDPVAVTPPEPLHGGNPVGWVNATFLVALPDGLPVTVDEVAPCTGEGDMTQAGRGDHPPTYVYALESGLVAPGCLRTVLTFGTGPVPHSWGDATSATGPADAVPAVFTAMSGDLGTAFDLGDVTSAWGGATETAQGLYVVRQPDRSIQLWSPLPARGVTLSALGERGVVVIDLALSPDRPVPATGPGVALTDQPRAWAGTVEVTGIARPFEADLGVRIESGDGELVEPVYSGSLVWGTVRTATYSVQTNDWTDAWGPFTVRAEDLEPGRYTMILDAAGGSDRPDTVRIPFTIAEAGTDEPSLATADELATVRALAAFARGQGPVSEVPLADPVTLGLGLVESRSVTRNDLADGDTWITETDEFDGLEGPFSALELLVGATAVRITTGPIPHCAGPPNDWPPELEGLRQVNVEPIGADSCLEWFGVILFLDDNDDIAAVIIDLYGP